MVNTALTDVAKRNNITLSQLPDALAQQDVIVGHDDGAPDRGCRRLRRRGGGSRHGCGDRRLGGWHG